jgi:transposase
MIWSSPGMRDDDGRKLDHKTLEQLRIRAVRQIEQGAHPEDVAAGLGMTQAAVYGWLAKYREGGLESLKARPVPGRPPTLSGVQLQRSDRQDNEELRLTLEADVAPIAKLRVTACSAHPLLGPVDSGPHPA